jgi:hypothetical protein
MVWYAHAHPLRAGDVLDGQVLALEAHGQLGEVVHVDHLVRAQVQRLVAVGQHDADGTLHAVVDEHEGARLQPVAPQLELARGHHGLATEGRRDLLAAALPRACSTAQHSTAQHSRLREIGYSKSMWCVVAAARSPRGPYTLWYLAMRVFTGKSLA